MSEPKVTFTDNSIEVKRALDAACVKFLYEAGGELEAEVRDRARVDNGQTKKQWTYFVDLAKRKVTVGNTLENAIWEEFGTGIHAEGDKPGKREPWYVPVESYEGFKKPTYQGKVVVVYGKDGVKYFKTDGKKAQHTLETAMTKCKSKLRKLAENAFKEKMR